MLYKICKIYYTLLCKIKSKGGNMLKDRLKGIDLRLTELADYLQLSRPTLYKFIDFYDMKNFEPINKKILKLFNYIIENELVGKKNIINYILTNMVDVQELGDKVELQTIKKIKTFLTSNPESKKSKFYDLVSEKGDYDDIIYYLVDIYPFLKKKKLLEEESLLLEPYNIFLKEIQKSKDKGDNK
jgi:hypothetical protein